MRFKAALFLVLWFCLPSRAQFCQRTVRPAAAGVQAGSSSLNVNEKKIPIATRRKLESLCWKFDDKTGLVNSLDGVPLSKAEYKEFLNPFLATDESPSREVEIFLEKAGYQFHNDGTVVIQDPKTGTSYVMSNLDFLSLESGGHLPHLKSKTADFGKNFTKQNLNNPLSSVNRVKFQLNQFFDGADSYGVLWKKALLNDAHSAFAAMTLPSFWESVHFQDVHTGEWSHHGAHFNSTSAEYQAGQLFQRQTVEVFSQNPIGVKILSHFEKNKRGEVSLPTMLILKTNPDTAAAYIPGDNILLFNQELVVQSILNQYPENQRQKMAELLSNSKAIDSWLISHPGDLNSFIGTWGEVIAHELTHAWQDRRIPLGPYVNRDPLDMEHEAFVWQNRYIMADILAHPDAALKNPNNLRDLPNLITMLHDYEGLLWYIDKLYLSGESSNSDSLSDIKDVVKKQEIDSLRFTLRRPIFFVKEIMKEWGLLNTEKAITNYQTDYAARQSRFLAEEYPQMQKDAKENFPALALSLVKKSLAESSDDEASSDMRTAVLLAKGSGDVALVSSIQVTLGQHLFKEALRETDLGRQGDLLEDAVNRIKLSGNKTAESSMKSQAKAIALRYLNSAKRTKNIEAQIKAVEEAEVYAHVAGDNDLIHAVNKIHDAELKKISLGSH